MRKLSIFNKLFLSVFMVAFFCIMAFGVLVYITQKQALITRTSEQLRSVNILKKEMIEMRLRDDEKFLWHFIKKIMLHDSAVSNFSPEKEFGRHKEFLRDFCNDYGHVDVMLLDENEQAVDSLFNGGNYAEVRHGRFTFARVFLINNSNYRLALVSSPEYLQKLLFENSGMGQSGESYLVASDLKMITKSRFFPQKPPREITVNTPSVVKALQNKTGTDIIPDYRGVSVLSAFVPITHKGLDWVLLSEIDKSEAMQPVEKLRTIILIVCVILLAGTFLVAVFLGKIIVAPIRQVSSGMDQLAQGRIPEKIPPPFFDNEESRMKLALNYLIESFERVTSFAGEIGKGNFKVPFAPLSPQDRLGTSLISMRDQFKSFREQEKVLRRQKAMSLLEGQENERRRLARDLHDGLGQWLTGLKLKIAILKLPAEEKEELKALVAETINETRRITNNLMPNTLVDFGLDSALRQLLSSVQKDGQLQIQYYFENSSSITALPFNVALSLYRIAQEALNNILKHALAGQVVFKVAEENGKLIMSVEDDGIGISDGKANGSGLGNMEERARLINGKFSIIKLNPGTRIQISVPLKAN